MDLQLTFVSKNKEEEKRDTTDKENMMYSNSQLSEVFLDKHKPSYIGDFIIMMDKHLYNRWGKLPVSLKTNKPVEETEGQTSGQDMYDQAKINQGIEQIQMFTRSMYGISVGPAMALPKIFDFSNHKKMLDIGGGSGIYSIQVVKANPNFASFIFNLLREIIYRRYINRICNPTTCITTLLIHFRSKSSVYAWLAVFFRFYKPIVEDHSTY